MTAIVTIPDATRMLGNGTVDVAVPRANAQDVDRRGWLHLKATEGGAEVALFKDWRYVIFTPDRGPDGRFVKRGDR